MTPLVCSQQDALFLDPALLGGKAANLAWLTREGLPVPRWWVVTTDVFRQLLIDNGVDAVIQDELARLPADADTAAIDPVSARIRMRVLQSRLSPRLRVAIAEALSGFEERYFAVRSSVLGEDAEGASFAGQMDSYLFQRGIDAICESLLQV